MHLEIYLCSAINGAMGVVLSKNNDFQKNPFQKNNLQEFLPLKFVFLIPCTHPFIIPICHKVNN